MAAIKLKSFTGMNNRAADNALPEGKLRIAHNVMFDNAGNLNFPRPGKTLRYTGDVHSIFVAPFITLFVEAGSLKKLNYDNTATTIATGLGAGECHYTVIGDTVYWATVTASGKIRNSVNSEWGVTRPTRQPDATAIVTGSLYAGDYRYAITWIGTTDESGTGQSTRITVPEGGGIQLSNFPTPPAYATLIAVYVSSVNGKDLYLYGEYPANTTSVTINRLTSEGVEPTIPLETQFCFKPVPDSLILAHYGRIYYVLNTYLYWTKPLRYGVQEANAYWTFDSAIQTVVSTPGALYVGTLTAIYRVSGIDIEEQAPLLEKLQECGTVKGSEAYDPDGNTAYFMSKRGLMAATSEGLKELSYEHIAMPFYASGCSTVIEQDGIKYLLFTGTGAILNTLQNADFSAAFPVLPVSWLVNLATGAIASGDQAYNSLSGHLGADSSGLYDCVGASDAGIAIDGYAETGKLDFKETSLKRVTDAYIGMDSDGLLLTVTTDNSSVAYNLPATTQLETVKANLARGAKGRYWQFRLDNVSGSVAKVDSVEFEVEKLSRRI